MPDRSHDESHLTLVEMRALLRNDAPAEALREYQSHVERCEQCRAAMEDERRWSGLLRMGDDRDASPQEEHLAAVERVLARVRLSRRRRRFLVGWSAGAVLLIGLAGLTLGIREGSGEAGASRRSRWGAEMADVERKSAEHVDALLAIQQDPWLLDDFETVTVIRQMMSKRGDGDR